MMNLTSCGYNYYRFAIAYGSQSNENANPQCNVVNLHYLSMYQKKKKLTLLKQMTYTTNINNDVKIKYKTIIFWGASIILYKSIEIPKYE